MIGILQGAITAVLIGLVLGLLTWIAARARPNSVDHATRRIVPNRTVMGAVASLCLALGGVAIYASIFRGGGAPALYVGVPFTAFGLLMATALSPRMDVIWDSVRIEGPASYGLPPFGPKRASVPFGDIVEVGEDMMGSLYVQDANGRRIRWNQYYSGFQDLIDHIAAVRPDLVDAPSD